MVFCTVGKVEFWNNCDFLLFVWMWKNENDRTSAALSDRGIDFSLGGITTYRFGVMSCEKLFHGH